MIGSPTSDKAQWRGVKPSANRSAFTPGTPVKQQNNWQIYRTAQKNLNTCLTFDQVVDLHQNVNFRDPR